MALRSRSLPWLGRARYDNRSRYPGLTPWAKSCFALAGWPVAERLNTPEQLSKVESQVVLPRLRVTSLRGGGHLANENPEGLKFSLHSFGIWQQFGGGGQQRGYARVGESLRCQTEAWLL